LPSVYRLKQSWSKHSWSWELGIYTASIVAGDIKRLTSSLLNVLVSTELIIELRLLDSSIANQYVAIILASLTTLYGDEWQRCIAWEDLQCDGKESNWIKSINISFLIITLYHLPDFLTISCLHVYISSNLVHNFLFIPHSRFNYLITIIHRCQWLQWRHAVFIESRSFPCHWGCTRAHALAHRQTHRLGTGSNDRLHCSRQAALSQGGCNSHRPGRASWAASVKTASDWKIRPLWFNEGIPWIPGFWKASTVPPGVLLVEWINFIGETWLSSSWCGPSHHCQVT
jgi:hypothetical protein